VSEERKITLNERCNKRKRKRKGRKSKKIKNGFLCKLVALFKEDESNF
jgi:hypothetical protein